MMKKVVFVLNACQEYRYLVLKRLIDNSPFDIHVLYSDIHNKNLSKLKSFQTINHPKFYKMKSISFTIKWNDRIYPLIISPGLIKALLRIGPDILILKDVANFMNNLSIMPFIWLKKIPYIIWGLCQINDGRQSFFRTLFHPAIKFINRDASKIFAYGTEAKRKYTRYTKSDKIVILQNTIDTIIEEEKIKKAQSNPQDQRFISSYAKKFVITYIGSLEKSKRVDLLIKAFATIKQDYPWMVLFLIGSGNQLNKLKEIVSKHGIPDVYFWGRQTEGIAKYLLATNLFVMPYLGGLAINQALVYSLPVFVGQADGTEKDLVVHGKNGFIIGPPQNVIANIIHFTRKFLNGELELNTFRKASSNIYLEKVRIQNFIRTFNQVLDKI